MESKHPKNMRPVVNRRKIRVVEAPESDNCSAIHLVTIRLGLTSPQEQNQRCNCQTE